MKQTLHKVLLALGVSISWHLQADGILQFETVDRAGVKRQETLSITQRWIRSESENDAKPDYRLMDTGRFLLFAVDDDKKEFQTYRVGKTFWPDAPSSPVLKPTTEKRSVAGVICRVVNEMGKDAPIAEHCMVTTGSLGLGPRDIIVLNRFFRADRTMGGDEIALGSPDERQISIYSRSLQDQRSRMIKSVVRKPAPDVKMKIPDDYERLRPDLPRDLVTDPAAYKKMLEEQKRKQSQ